MSKFIYDDDIPVYLLPELRRYLEPLEWLVPSWCNRVFIGWNGAESKDDGVAIMDNLVRYPYRWARITFYGRWTNQTDDLKPHLVAHEILHIAIDPLYHYACDVLGEIAADNDDLRRRVQTEMTDRVEAVTEDLAMIIGSRPAPARVWFDESIPEGVKPNGKTKQKEESIDGHSK